MKKILFYCFAAILCSLTFTSCENDDDDITAGNLVGIWQWADSSEDEAMFLSFWDGHDYELYVIEPEGEYTDDGTWKLDGNKLTLYSEEDGRMDITVTKLTSKELRLSSDGETLRFRKISNDPNDGE